MVFSVYNIYYLVLSHPIQIGGNEIREGFLEEVTAYLSLASINFSFSQSLGKRKEASPAHQLLPILNSTMHGTRTCSI